MVFKIVLIICGLGIAFVLKSYYDRIRYRERMKALFEQEWGFATRDEYSDQIMRNIRYYHEQKKTEDTIDEITWNDLELEQVFRQMNHTRTSAGEEYLYHILRTPEFTEDILLERERVIQCYQKNPDVRLALELALHEIGKTDHISVYEFLSDTDKLVPIKRWHHVLACALMTGAVLSLLLAPVSSLAILFVVMLGNVYFYYQEKAKVVKALALFEFIIGTVRQCDVIASLELTECKEYLKRLKETAGRFDRFCRFHFLVSGGSSMSGNIFDALFDYVRILFHVDLIKLATMIHEVQKYQKELLEMYDMIGYLDSMLAVASYRESVEIYTTPVFYGTGAGLHSGDVPKNGQGTKRMDMPKEKIQQLKLVQVYHPLVHDPVKNDIAAKKCVLLTGSNASGKSTFLKAVAINVLLAQTIHTVLAEQYEACFFRLYSSMALRDDILAQESYFIVEIKSLKRIFSAIDRNGAPVLCFVDEILRGTNTVERVAASSELLEALSEKPVMCFAATHDMELTYLLEDKFSNYHFEEQFKKGDILFDYCLKQGRADSRNAIRLLSMIGFEDELIQKAQERVEYFLKNGNWQ